MKYEVLKDGIAGNGRQFIKGTFVELDKDYAEHLVKRKIVQAVNFEKPKKSRAVNKPSDLEQATE